MPAWRLAMCPDDPTLKSELTGIFLSYLGVEPEAR
jgi:hypothetical protein